MAVGFIGDEDVEVTFAAVGRAMSRWEAVELAFANLYALFTSGSLALDRISAFGSENRIFANRLSALKKAATQYFVSHPDQRNEGEFIGLCEQANSLSKSRNNIAHGIVQQVTYLKLPDSNPPIYLDGPTLYMLQVPWYVIDRVNDMTSSGAGAAEILNMSIPFTILEREMDMFVRRLHPLLHE